MKYKVADEAERGKALAYLLDIFAKGKGIVEVKKVPDNRSLRQNAYLHLILGGYGLETGHTLEEAKTIYKRDANPEIYVYRKNGVPYLKSSKELDTAEMTKSIDRFREFAGEQGIYLPPPENADELRSIENAMEQSNYIRSENHENR